MRAGIRSSILAGIVAGINGQPGSSVSPVEDALLTEEGGEMLTEEGGVMLNEESE